MRLPLRDFTAEVVVMGASGDLVNDVIRWSTNHLGDVMGIRATHRSDRDPRRQGLDGLIVERWGSWDQYGLLDQLGVLPAPV